MITRGRKLGERVTCALCGRMGYSRAGNLKQLTAPIAYPYYPRTDRPALPRDATVWCSTGDYVCTFHMQLKPQPARPAEVL